MFKIALVLGMFLFSVQDAHAEDIDPVVNTVFVERNGVNVPTPQDLNPALEYFYSSLASIGYTEEDLVEAALGTALEGLVNSDGSVPSYQFLVVESNEVGSTFGLPVDLAGKIMLFVSPDLSSDVFNVTYYNQGADLNKGYTVWARDLSFILIDDAFVPLREYLDGLRAGSYSRFVNGRNRIDAGYSSTDIMRSRVVAFNRTNVEDSIGNYFLNYDSHRLESFEKQVFQNMEVGTDSELYTIFVWTIAGLLFYGFIFKPTSKFLSMHVGRGSVI